MFCKADKPTYRSHHHIYGGFSKIVDFSIKEKIDIHILWNGSFFGMIRKQSLRIPYEGNWTLIIFSFWIVIMQIPLSEEKCQECNGGNNFLIRYFFNPKFDFFYQNELRIMFSLKWYRNCVILGNRF